MLVELKCEEQRIEMQQKNAAPHIKSLMSAR